MVVCKDRLDRNKDSQRMGEAAAAVEADINVLLSGKSYDHLVALQKQIQAKLASGEPVDTDYWEGLLKKLLVWKAKVLSGSDNVGFIVYMTSRLSSRVCMKLLFAIDWSSSGNANEMKRCRHRKSYWQVLLSQLCGALRMPVLLCPPVLKANPRFLQNASSLMIVP